MACLHPVRPWVLPGPSGLPFLAAPAVPLETAGALLSCTSTPPGASLSCARHGPFRPMSTMIRKGSYLA
jgi:hypothetical protein